MSKSSWMRYGHHLFEGIAIVFGLDIAWVRSLNNLEGHDIIQIRYNNNLNIILEFIENIELPIEFTCFSENSAPFSIPFTDYFNSFSKMMKCFVEMIKTNKKPIQYPEIISIAKVILAGEISKQKKCQKINPKTLKPI